ncbi:MAG: nitroreductase family protein [Chloroflexota bacterium]
MDVYEALYTTRAMRRMRPDPIPYSVQARILDTAIRAPSGAGLQPWRFLLVDDPALKAQLASYYREGHKQIDEWVAETEAAAQANPDDPGSAGFLANLRSSRHLADHFEDVPLLLFGFVQNDTSGANILFAIWNAMLAARAEGVGSGFTTLLNSHAEAVKTLLGVPTDQGWEMACCVALGYPTGRWGVPKRRPAHEVSARNSWDGALGFQVPEPLWPE